MEVDTGRSVTFQNSYEFFKLRGEVNTLKPPIMIFLKSYTGNTIHCLIEKEMDVKVGEQVGALLIRVTYRHPHFWDETRCPSLG